ncbi:MAG TPA: SDR family oxidoreductase [Candidatus Latescibacteria bacterium]|jgi:short-subunit dehydrogenase|nr:short-chain dehydrogenase [Gemmatimonadaceae bacterium]MDP6019024.1 SDR family oxidoreductase [Candidatus Latescibacterota bacterium]HJP33851.1 SDR family oxidoreductase [Candidatus Latescibacterota bacterium]|tara:strand:+ start:1794 stop:2546 length:753 start_codon:yes stop_codon:yes gene_type:complete
MSVAPGSRALILGARSVIAQAIAEGLARQGWDLVLAARRSSTLEPVAADLRLRTERIVDLLEFDALALDDHATLADRVRSDAGQFHLVVCVFGVMGEAHAERTDTSQMVQTLTTNFTAAAVCLAHLANDFESRGEGGIICIGSVAGDRGRQSNYPYGAAKAGLSTFLQGLRNRLAPTGVHVLTVKPGFVDTPMTQGKEGMFLVAPSERVAADILRAWKQRRDVLYTPWFWRWLLLVIRLIPERIFKRLKL